ncbi:phosphoenolpyruvate mutase [Bacillus spizizenii]|mgnify:CR=1 FL=1|uniref:phosphoenolpyruvate mutase n=2 Tax=Bacillus spizizenii TaxID=96241 RepID=E0U086_BACSH|nr:phosphoenolpyruvate mutase [Bacillus spizizenii]QCJ19320.1 phosphoenolpyruvate mutase [Bacillus subtilis]ADB43073.1 phosphoenolpyruvate phosphomutase [Bacillus spizizenii ATCC 6633 = JCM 2499]ADM36257.1 phosphoenolpyruvate mutase [Bacillus spizizenii str. W23]AJW85727.1 phosphoenolpyruvate phosphomutase [Bacillus spizizenii]EFG91534.1 phosphoenolpyruvate mutase [Bacillus spizizenii ATCC 6633 = JCM 2499]
MKAKKLRELLYSNQVVRVMGAHNGLSAKLAEQAGFHAIWASGLEISASYAVPDANILTMTENLQAAVVMNESTSIPIICDCDSGYGSVNNVIRMVKEYERNGIAGICIEDKQFPKLNSFVKGSQKLADIDEFSNKIRAAKDVQKNPDFVVIARIEALIAGQGMDEALNRAYAYEAAGADAILIHSKENQPNEIKEFVKQFTGAVPIVIVPTTYPHITVKEMELLGINMVIYANHGLRSSIKAMQETFSQILLDGNTVGVEDNIVSMKTVFELQGMYDMRKQEDMYNSGTSVISTIK